MEVLGQIYQPYMEVLFARCYKFFRTEEDARDTVMELFEKLNVELKIHEPQNFKAWLYSVARNHCLMKLRQRVPIEIGKPLEDLEEKDEGDAGYRVSDVRLDRLTVCLNRLPDNQRRSISLFYLEGKCYREIAEVTGFDISKVKSYIQNGKRNLKNCLERNENA